MTDGALFGAGLLVTVLAAPARLIMGATMDGKENDQAQAERSSPDAGNDDDADRVVEDVFVAPGRAGCMEDDTAIVRLGLLAMARRREGVD